MPNNESGPPVCGTEGARATAGETSTLTVPPAADWSTAYAASLAWVRTVGRARWPWHAVNNEIWAASVADWLLGGRRAVVRR